MAFTGPNVDRYTPQRSFKPMFDKVAFDLVSAVQDAVAGGNSRTSQKLILFAEQLGDFGTSSQRLQANQTLADMMHDSVLRSFRRAKSKFGPVYTRNNRMRPGGLESAIRNPGNLFRVTDRSIEFINEKALSVEARQWARLNYGAGPRGLGSREPTVVRFSNVVVGFFGLEQPARPNILLPPGFFMPTEGRSTRWRPREGRSDPFFPTRTRPLRPTRGFTGYQFLDAGVSRLAREIGPVYKRLFDDVAVASARRGRPFGTYIARPGGYYRAVR